MPLTCPACGRGNHERLTECLYCGEPLPDPSPRPGGEVRGEATPSAVTSGAVLSGAVRPREEGGETAPEDAPRPSLLVLAPGEVGADGLPTRDRVSPRRIEALRDALQLDPYSARQVLATLYPKVVARGDPPRLDALAARLSTAGLAGAVVPPEALDALGEVVAVRAAQRVEHGTLALVGPAGPEVLEPGSVRVIVRADIRVEWVGPRPDARRRARRTDAGPGLEDLDQMRSDYPVVEIQRHRAPRVRIEAPSFDFSGLGPGVGPSALLNLRDLVARLRRESPRAVLDEGFRFLPAESDPVDGIFGAFGSNESQFDRYASIVGAFYAEVAAGRGFAS